MKIVQDIDNILNGNYNLQEVKSMTDKLKTKKLARIDTIISELLKNLLCFAFVSPYGHITESIVKACFTPVALSSRFWMPLIYFISKSSLLMLFFSPLHLQVKSAESLPHETPEEFLQLSLSSCPVLQRSLRLRDFIIFDLFFQDLLLLCRS